MNDDTKLDTSLANSQALNVFIKWNAC